MKTLWLISSISVLGTVAGCSGDIASPDPLSSKAKNETSVEIADNAAIRDSWMKIVKLAQSTSTADDWLATVEGLSKDHLRHDGTWSLEVITPDVERKSTVQFEFKNFSFDPSVKTGTLEVAVTRLEHIYDRAGEKRYYEQQEALAKMDEENRKTEAKIRAYKIILGQNPLDSKPEEAPREPRTRPVVTTYSKESHVFRVHLFFQNSWQIEKVEVAAVKDGIDAHDFSMISGGAQDKFFADLTVLAQKNQE
jgi:hypothetical protein